MMPYDPRTAYTTLVLRLGAHGPVQEVWTTDQPIRPVAVVDGLRRLRYEDRLWVALYYHAPGALLRAEPDVAGPISWFCTTRYIHWLTPSWSSSTATVGRARRPSSHLTRRAYYLTRPNL